MCHFTQSGASPASPARTTAVRPPHCAFQARRTPPAQPLLSAPRLCWVRADASVCASWRHQRASHFAISWAAVTGLWAVGDAVPGAAGVPVLPAGQALLRPISAPALHCLSREGPPGSARAGSTRPGAQPCKEPGALRRRAAPETGQGRTGRSEHRTQASATQPHPERGLGTEDGGLGRVAALRGDREAPGVSPQSGRAQLTVKLISGLPPSREGHGSPHMPPTPKPPHEEALGPDAHPAPSPPAPRGAAARTPPAGVSSPRETGGPQRADEPEHPARCQGDAGRAPPPAGGTQ